MTRTPQLPDGAGDATPLGFRSYPDPALMPCESCGAQPGEKHRATEPVPDEDQIELWVFDSVCEATDGCTVEGDGRCSHGHSSWLLTLGLI